MSKQHPFCFIGEKDLVEPFRIFGVEVYEFEAKTWPEIEKKIAQQEYKILFVTEEVVPFLPAKNVAAVVLPGKESLFFSPEKTSLGYERLRHIIINAVGMDILTE